MVRALGTTPKLGLDTRSLMDEETFWCQTLVSTIVI